MLLNYPDHGRLGRSALKILAAWILTCALLAACATPYQPHSATGGFTDAQLGPELWTVTFRASGATPADDVRNMMLLRSAELTYAAGFSHFSVRSLTDMSQRSVVSSGGFGWGAFLGVSQVVNSPHFSITIDAYKGRPQGPVAGVSGTVYDSAFLIGSLAPKYKSSTSANASKPEPLVRPAFSGAAPQSQAQPVALQPAQATSPPPPTPSTRTTTPVEGQEAFNAERLARESKCVDANVRATFVGKGPGYETYSMRCSNGETLLIRCELGNCRALR
jgi:hypothetical protein